ncbi:transposase [Gemmata sp.]|uniref:transposase n=1 Tax=Gemmata sp. TaxID=1914242 RepID=UPI003F6FD813
MSPTCAPDLDPGVLARLREYAAGSPPSSPGPSRPGGPWYTCGLLPDGGRKSVAPLSHRVTPTDLASKDTVPALQQFDRQSPWDHGAVLRRFRAHPAATFATSDSVLVIDDTTFPRQGKHSVGVQRQDCGRWARRPTAGPLRPPTTRRRGTTRWPCNSSTRPNPGWPTPTGWTGPVCPGARRPGPRRHRRGDGRGGRVHRTAGPGAAIGRAGVGVTGGRQQSHHRPRLPPHR